MRRKSVGRLMGVCVALSFVAGNSGCGTKKKLGQVGVTSDFSDLLAEDLKVRLRNDGLSDSEAATLADAAKAKSKSNTSLSLMHLTSESDSLKLKAVGFAGGAVGAMDEAGIMSSEKKLKIVSGLSSVLGSALSKNKGQLSGDMKSIPALIAASLVVGLKDAGELPDLGQLLKEVSKSTMGLSSTMGVEASDRDDAAKELLSATVKSLDDLGVEKAKVSEFSADLMRGAMDGIPEGSSLEEMKSYIFEISSGLAVALKEAGLSEAEAVVALGDIAEKSVAAFADISADKATWDELSEQLTKGCTKGVGDASFSDDSLKDALSEVNEGIILGVSNVKNELTAEQIAEISKKAASGSTAGLVAMGVDDAKMDGYIDDIMEGANAGLESSELDDSLKDQLKESVASGSVEILESTMSAADFADLQLRKTFLSQLMSSYGTQCAASKESSQFEKEDLQIGNGTMDMTYTLYSDEACTVPIMSVSDHSTFELEDAVEGQVGSFGMKKNLQTLLLTLFAKSFVELYNAMPYGGDSSNIAYNYPAGTFVAGVPVDIKGRMININDKPEALMDETIVKVDESGAVCFVDGKVYCYPKK